VILYLKLQPTACHYAPPAVIFPRTMVSRSRTAFRQYSSSTSDQRTKRRLFARETPACHPLFLTAQPYALNLPCPSALKYPCLVKLVGSKFAPDPSLPAASASVSKPPAPCAILSRQPPALPQRLTQLIQSAESFRARLRHIAEFAQRHSR